MSGKNMLRKLLTITSGKNLKTRFPNLRRSKPRICACVIGGATALTAGYFAAGNYIQLPSVYAKKNEPEIKLTSSEKRFIKFASSQYDGQLYMTPQDFLESVIHEEPRPRIQRKILTKPEMRIIKDKTPMLEQGSSRMFRDMNYEGTISYVEYLFLLSILYKPQTAFEIAFNAFDRDGNGVVDLEEFRIIERIFSNTWKGKRGLSSGHEEDHYIDDEQGLQRKHDVDTTLKVHFFGVDGQSVLDFESFRKFMSNLQMELLEIEFSEFARGLPIISEVEFAKIILRYSFLDVDEYDAYLDNVLDRIPESVGISFKEFRAFCEFLSFLDDFSYAIYLYMILGEDVDKDEFHRAVKVCTGIDLSRHLVETIFAIFGSDKGLLDCKDFIKVMKDRQKREFQVYPMTEGWQAFKACVKNEISREKSIKTIIL
nr:unnamed protein product [Callosobruchus analis]